ncbi:MAG: hypothetical protein JJ909_08365 [Roseivirga sp.]|jgi:hypothetical protein|uniref:hypothetical protein n=1 Tax=Roseivirga sp. TaxID=1964215 RepID=UPI001B0682F5|nr:hypothetical protein [Roseivirga sp.]MBO6495553.1 hypothetical protein [Roseivirga sp.]MBO6661663.1 hypothetical protein [Roseivirga sp.]MBO6760970.1 hypothetical protein [Roseivirga sp.]MBO6908352.1 hypothetical protein [Roseivirga sp.]|tara:strand:- start:281 stop:448 length:168 start_codon:yes stop_codon:yes gene_type:complete
MSIQPLSLFDFLQLPFARLPMAQGQHLIKASFLALMPKVGCYFALLFGCLEESDE